MNDSLDYGWWLNSIAWEVSQWITISQEHINAIRESEQQSAQAAAQRKQSKVTASWLSSFLSFVFKSIYNNDELHQSIYQTFFVHKNSDSWLLERHKTINTELLVGLFVAFYPQKAKEFWLISIYERYYDFYSPLNLSKYLHSIKAMMHAFWWYQNSINHIAYIQCLAYIIVYFKQAWKQDALPHTGHALWQLIQEHVYK